MIVGVRYNMINIKTGVVHGMPHPSESLCGIHTGFRNQNINLEKTNKKITCKRCLREVNSSFKDWSDQYEMRETTIEPFDEVVHSSQIIDTHVFL